MASCISARDGKCTSFINKKIVGMFVNWVQIVMNIMGRLGWSQVTISLNIDGDGNVYTCFVIILYYKRPIM